MCPAYGVWSGRLPCCVPWALTQPAFDLVVNRWHRADDEPLRAFEKRVKLPIFERLPNDFKQVSRAVNMGAELARGQNDQLVQKFRSMAEQITGVRSTSRNEARIVPRAIFRQGIRF